jgi:hypothetical protein
MENQDFFEQFNKDNDFDVHIVNSIPNYKQLRDLVVSIAPSFISDCTTYVDIGCSTGSLPYRVYKEAIVDKFISVDVIGLDQHTKMFILNEDCDDNDNRFHLKEAHLTEAGVKGALDYHG